MDNNTEELQVIKTVGENGEEVELKLLDIVTVDDTDYALLLPVDEEANEDSEVVLMRLKKEGDEYLFETIEDDDEFNEVAKLLAEDDECNCDCDEGCDCGCHNH